MSPWEFGHRLEQSDRPKISRITWIWATILEHFPTYCRRYQPALPPNHPRMSNQVGMVWGSCWFDGIGEETKA